MTTATLTLTAFLLARIEDDEAAARAAMQEVGDSRWQAGEAAYEGIAVWSAAAVNTYGDSSATTDHIARHDPARVLAECEARRRIVEEHAEDHNCVRYVDVDDNRDCYTLRALAAIYADDPDYDEAWKP